MNVPIYNSIAGRNEQKIVFFSHHFHKKSSSANSIILNLIPFERIKPRSFRVYQNSSVSFSFLKQKILDALVSALEGRKSLWESRG